MADPAHPDPRPPAADGERALPEEIASAIEALVNAIGYAASDDGVFLEDMNCDEARSALTTSILSRLTAAEAGREEAEARALGWERTLLYCEKQWNDTDSITHAKMCAALARVERLEKALGDAAADFDSIANSADPFDDAVGTQDHGLLLAVEKMAGAAGEKVRSALTEAQPKGDQ
jgi:hypothetical protein